MAPTIHAVSQASEVQADRALLAGVKDVLEGLKPGLTVEFYYDLPGGHSQILVVGDKLICTVGSATSSTSIPFSGWALLNPGERYDLSLGQGHLEVSAVV